MPKVSCVNLDSCVLEDQIIDLKADFERNIQKVEPPGHCSD